VADAIVEPGQAAPLAELFAHASEGLPLALVTLVNAMWDERELVPAAAGRWSFRGSPARWAEPAREGMAAVIRCRVRRLPTSTRRLASMAAVIGVRFDTELLRRAEDEHAAVVEVGLELLLERWLVRQHRERWNPTGLESSLALWSRGARRGRFLFDHPRIRRSLYEDLNPLRRQVLHGQIAAALEALHADDLDAAAEPLAHHHLQAGNWESAHRWLARSAARSEAAGDSGSAAATRRTALKVVERLLAQAPDDAERRRWQEEASQLARPGDPQRS
jgi:predicted ATPase